MNKSTPRYYQFIRRNVLGEVNWHVRLPADGLHPEVEKTAEAFMRHIVVLDLAYERLKQAQEGMENAAAVDQAALLQRITDDPQSVSDGVVPTEGVDAATSELVNANAMVMAAENRLSQVYNDVVKSLRKVAPDWRDQLHEKANRSRLALAGAVYTCERELASLGDTLGLMGLLDRITGEDLVAGAGDPNDGKPEVRDVPLLDPAIDATRAMRALVGSLASVPGMVNP